MVCWIVKGREQVLCVMRGYYVYFGINSKDYEYNIKKIRYQDLYNNVIRFFMMFIKRLVRIGVR